MPDFAALREEMVERQLKRRGIAERALLDAFRAVPRELFVPEAARHAAYDDSPLPIEAGQTVSQPYIAALMIEAAGIGRDDSVLEIGAGSGYAAAVLGRVAGRVVAVERHGELAALARARMEALGYSNVRIVEGDGSGGLPDEAPFAAILVAASGSHVPEALLEQLGLGGVLVMPVGERDAVQRLVKVTRTGEEDYEEEDLGPVRFVPLIGREGWGDGEGAAEALPERLRAAAEPLPELDDPAFAEAFDRFADARVVLLGEASHGTSEFYRARAEISKRLIERHGFTIVAVEADWPDAASVDRHVRHRARRDGEETAFQRFPTWMWRNAEVDAFVGWLRRHNEGRGREAMTGFYGLDLYNLSGSIRAVIDFLEAADPEAAKLARKRYACLAPWSRDPAAYGRHALSEGYGRCEAGAVQMLRDLLQRRMDCLAEECDEWLDAAANARLVRNAEQYYRVMYQGAAESWNLRDTHMFETLCQLLDAKGPASKAIVWAHNSHIGNAAHTEMGQVREELNVGQLAKERFGDAARLIGFGTHGGTVAAADDWDAPMEVKLVRPSLAGSYERLCHETGIARFLLDLRPGALDPALEEALLEPRLERFIGVIYRPETERWSHYAEAVLPNQFDAWAWFDETRAVTPLPGGPPAGAEEETYPFGL
ncbi:MAG: protein-L-isoaspartate(D-aspartate) O-methyltransferase [Alphaproteobacteria bacterium]|nr:protein-L-isoaspartate(D-aspartate) O-methyltransferase [Alphaproteobacteria bacterium]MBV9370367.1 protein-L-isoaspartate(D-aspartate) O-methyltransferase [Alphaproteobacteria bacterium]MBV9901976.1 protein-L-isoaspartate(D-aspartate) O-methyltransferase [Alphaproteobacteria bacterium]